MTKTVRTLADALLARFVPKAEASAAGILACHPCPSNPACIRCCGSSGCGPCACP